MFDSLHPPADLGAARARLHGVAERLAGSGAVAHLRPADEAGEADPTGVVDGTGAVGQPDGEVAQPPWPGFDDGATVVVADTVLWRTDHADLRAVASMLGPDRSLLFLEPTADVGWRRLAHRLARPLWRRATGHHFETDVPVAARAAGLEVVDLNRFSLGPAGIRSYALGRAISLR